MMADRVAYMREYNARNRERVNAKMREHRAANRERMRAEGRERYASNPERGREQRRITSRQWAEMNRGLMRERSSQWAKDNPARHRANIARRRAAVLQATPAWADSAAIDAIYDAAVEISLLSGLPHEVDHIVPLRGRNVCGLHVENNLQVLPLVENRAKGNNHD